MKNIVIIGGGNAGKDVIHVIESINQEMPEWNILGIIDENKNLHGKDYLCTKYLGSMEWFDNYTEEIHVICGIGKTNVKKRLIENLSKKENIKFPNLIHPTAIISKYAKIGQGNIFAAFCQIQPESIIGNFNYFNLSTHIGHNCEIGNYCTLNPNVGVYNCSKIGNECYVGAGAIIIQNADIKDNVLIAAGSLVNKSVQKDYTVYGNPCKIIKKNFIKFTD